MLILMRLYAMFLYNANDVTSKYMQGRAILVLVAKATRVCGNKFVCLAGLFFLAVKYHPY
jgi:hypothetical protein